MLTRHSHIKMSDNCLKILYFRKGSLSDGAWISLMSSGLDFSSSSWLLVEGASVVSGVICSFLLNMLTVIDNRLLHIDSKD